MELPGLINELLEKNQPFVSYRLPETVEPITLLGGTFTQTHDWQTLQNKSGFVVAPFAPAPENPFLIYEGGSEITGWNTNLNKPNLSFIPLSGKGDVPHCADFKQYESQFNHLVKLIKMGELQKVVLSRVLGEVLPASFSAGVFFSQLCSAYPKAFVYIFHDGRGGLWTGATPETLIEAEEGHARTMSLAGTKSANTVNMSELEWLENEKLEQKLVTIFIRKTLIDCGISGVTEARLEVRPAGPVFHLLKRFSFEIPNDLSVLELAMRLHPTPAVCGLPQHEAFDEIQKTELHNRAWYSGFLGPVTNKHTSHLFVNLRCMQIIGKNAFIFAGGGLLSESDSLREWQETVLKAETLLSVIRKFN